VIPMAEWNVVVRLRVMPTGVEADLGKVMDGIKAMAGGKFEVHSMEEKPIAFGLKALEVNLLFNDSRGGMDEIQERIRRMEGVGEVDVTDINRL